MNDEGGPESVRVVLYRVFREIINFRFENRGTQPARGAKRASPAEAAARAAHRAAFL